MGAAVGTLERVAELEGVAGKAIIIVRQGGDGENEMQVTQAIHDLAGEIGLLTTALTEANRKLNALRAVAGKATTEGETFEQLKARLPSAPKEVG